MRCIPYREQLQQGAGKELHIQGCRFNPAAGRGVNHIPIEQRQSRLGGEGAATGSFMGPESISGNPIKTGGYKWAPRIGFDIQLSFPFQLS